MHLEDNLVNSYSILLEHLSDDNKLELISRLSQSVRRKKKKSISIDALYGAWGGDKSAEEIIAEIRAARVEKTNFPEF